MSKRLMVAGGTRADYVAGQQRSAAAPAALAGLLALLISLLGLGLWQVGKQAQRYSQVDV